MLTQSCPPISPHFRWPIYVLHVNHDRPMFFFCRNDEFSRGYWRAKKMNCTGRDAAYWKDCKWRWHCALLIHYSIFRMAMWQRGFLHRFVFSHFFKKNHQFLHCQSFNRSIRAYRDLPIFFLFFPPLAFAHFASEFECHLVIDLRTFAR